MKIKKYQNSPGPLQRDTITIGELPEGYLSKYGNRIVVFPSGKRMTLREARKEYGPTHIKTSNLPGYDELQLPYQEQNDINDARQMQIRQGDRSVRDRSMTQPNKTEMNNLANIGLTIGGTAAAIPAFLTAPIATVGAFAGGIGGNFLGDKATQQFSDGKYNTWGDAMQYWTNGYIRADNGQITNPGALLGGAIGGAAAKPIFNFGKNMFNVGRNYFGNNSRLSFTNANQTVTPTTTSGLNLDTNLGEIIGRMRLGLKNTREYYNGEGFAQRMRNAGFTEDEIGQARMEINKTLSNANIEVLQGSEKGLHGRAGRSFSADPETFSVIPKMKIEYFPNQTKNSDDFINNIFHELTGHGSTLNVTNRNFSSSIPTAAVTEMTTRLDYPMIGKMMDYNESLLMRPNVKVVDKLPNGKSNFDYLTNPQEIRARAIEEIMTGRPNVNHRTGFQIFNEGDWNAYLQQFLKKGGKIISQEE